MDPTERFPGLPSTLPKRLRLLVVAGPDRGRSLEVEARPYVIGKDEGCDLVLTDPRVSRRHLEIDVRPDAIELRDLQSTNGSWCGGARFDAIRGGVFTSVTVGDTEIRIVPADDAAAGVERFGRLVGASARMKALFAAARRVAATDAPVLLQGESGTGKELLAAAIHEASPRAGGPFVICDLAAGPRSLIESELFGHVRGAFTGADRERVGAFKQAAGGTIFLDEVGELEPEVQPRLLRVLETRQMKPVGHASYLPVDARVVAATNRDLSDEVKEGRFRTDLYHRLAVVLLEIPPLRDRPEEIPVLAQSFLEEAAGRLGKRPPAIAPATMAAMAAHDWPGNVRQLRNVLERAVVLDPDAPALNAAVLGLGEPGAGGAGAGAAHGPPADPSLPFKEAKNRLVETWERSYLEALLERAGGNVTTAARQAGIARVSLHRLLRKYGMRADDP